MISNQQSTDAFWVWWALTLALCLWQLWRAWTRPREALGFAMLACVLWLYIYCYLPYHLISEQRLFFQPDIWNFAQFIAFVSLLSLLAGWHWKLNQFRKPSPPSRPEPQFHLDRLWWCGVGALVVGVAGFYSFVHSGREFTETTAYWYLLFHTCYPGIALCVVVLALSVRHRSVLNWCIVTLLAVLIIVPLLAGARRGPTFAALIASTFSFAAIRRKPVPPAVMLTVLCFAGFLLLFLVTARRVTYAEGGSWQEFLKTASVREVLSDRARRPSDNEYFNHCQMLEAILRTGRYQYGTAHLAVLLNWVPRALWLEKPQRGTGFFPEAVREIERDEASNLGVGGAWGAVADSFNNYWYFFPLFWAAIGWLTASAFLKAREPGALSWKLHNVGILCASHWFIAQNFSEAFVPFMIYQGVFFIAFRFAAVPAVRQRPRISTSGHESIIGASWRRTRHPRRKPGSQAVG